jgi:hypothetical protein
MKWIGCIKLERGSRQCRQTIGVHYQRGQEGRRFGERKPGPLDAEAVEDARLVGGSL